MTLNAGSGSAASTVFFLPKLRAGGHSLSASYAGEGNFAASSVSGSLTVEAMPLTVAMTAANKVYDGITAARVTFGDDRLAGDMITVMGKSFFSDKNVGTSKTATVSSPYILGQDAANYVLAGLPANASADIKARPIKISADSKTKGSGEADPALTYRITSGGLAINDTFTGSLTRLSGEMAGSYAIEQGTLTAGGNYQLTYVEAELKIADLTLPSVMSTTPAVGATDVPVTSMVKAVFSEDMNPATINEGTFILSNDVAGSVVYDAGSRTATFTPSINLSNNTTYTARIMTGVKDLAGNALGSDYTWSFSTPVLIVSWMGGSGNWSDGSKWSSGVVPGSANDVLITLDGTYTVTLDTDATVNSLKLDGSSGTQTLAASGKTLTINDAGHIGSRGAMNLSGNTISGAGSLTNQGAINLTNSTINTALNNAGTVNVYQGNMLNGALTTQAGSKITVMGHGANYSSNAYDSGLVVANGFTNNGALELTHDNDYSYCYNPRNAYVAVGSGTLVNAAGGSISSLAGYCGQGTRYLYAEVDNRGTITTSYPLTISKGSAGHLNSGTITVNADLTISQSGTSPDFTNNGALMIASGQTMTVSGGMMTNSPTGILQGTGILNLSGTTFGNSGAINPDTTGLAGTLTLTGQLKAKATSAVNIDIGGTTSGPEYDQLIVNGPATLNGTLEVNLINGYEPAIGNSFTIMTYGSRSGAFSTINLPALGHGMNWKLTYGPANASLDIVPDTTAPWVIGTTPGNGATNISKNVVITAIFSEALDPSTINNSTILVTGASATGVVAVSGLAAYSSGSNMVSFTPSADLAPSVTYTATITTGIKDLAGNSVAAPYFWTFTTAAPADVICPITLSQNQASFVNTGGMGIIQVTGDSSCNWSAVSNASWLTITGGDTGSGNGMVNYSVSPNMEIMRTGTMAIGGKTFTVTQAAAAPVITVLPSSMDFGPVDAGASSAMKAVTITNTGTLSLTISGIEVGGFDSTAFNQTNDCLVLIPSSSCSISLTFKPLSNGSYSAALSIFSNDPAILRLNIDLTGRGVVKGDLDNGDYVTLKDAILALQVISGLQPSEIRTDYVESRVDVDGDDKIGLPEVIYILQYLVGIR